MHIYLILCYACLNARYRAFLLSNTHPKYENGILSFIVPKKEQKAVEEKNKFISIEG